MSSTTSNKIKIASNNKIYGYMLLGLTTSIAFRLLIILNHVEPAWVRPVWYFAVLGNLIFFYYRFKISRKRKDAVRNHQLINKIESGSSLNDKERHALIYLLHSIDRSKESFNYLIISIFSVFAIIMDITIAYIY